MNINNIPMQPNGCIGELNSIDFEEEYIIVGYIHPDSDNTLIELDYDYVHKISFDALKAFLSTPEGKREGFFSFPDRRNEFYELNDAHCKNSNEEIANWLFSKHDILCSCDEITDIIYKYLCKKEPKKGG